MRLRMAGEATRPAPRCDPCEQCTLTGAAPVGEDGRKGGLTLTLRPRTCAAALVTALLCTCAMAGPASAASKPYSLIVAPSTVAGGQQVTFTATFTNATAQQQLGSANLRAPAGFSVISAVVPSPATATVSGSVVELRNLAIQPRTSLTATVVAAVPCGAAEYTWSVVAKQSNDFSGLPGNDFGPLTSDSKLKTSVEGGCALRFATQPANAEVGKTITTTPYTPTGGPITVEVVDGAGNRLTTSSARITISLAPGSGTGALSGTTTVDAVNGVAAFSDLKISASGSYAFVASSPGLTSATSSGFRIDDVVTVCSEDLTCTATASNANTTLDVTASSNAQADAGALVIDSHIADRLDCAGYTELSRGDFAVDFIASSGVVGREKVVTLTIDKQTMNELPSNGAALLNMCFGAPFQFAVKPGTPALQQQQGLYVGLLPDCGVPPCVSKRNKTRAGQGVIEARAPGGNQDPRYSG
jgi:hypothetical protein